MKRYTNKDSDSICATITAPGSAGVSVIRVSGGDSESIVRKLSPFLPSKLESHRIYYGYLQLEGAGPGFAIDEVLVSYFQGGKSFTGEPTFEISCHGNPLIAAEILSSLCASGARLAERGEFTFRAFMNGRIDLIQAESVLDLVQSRSKSASRLALRQLQGRFSGQIGELLQELTWILANLEADIDFSAEDIVVAGMEQLASRTEAALRKTESLLAEYRKGRILKSGYQVALSGRPNAGKSSVLNRWVGEEKAIVTAIPGTTRDLIEAELSVDGYLVQLIDTAGIRATEDEVEKIGVERSRARAAVADRVFYIVDGASGWTADDAENIREIPAEKILLVWNKADLQEPNGLPDIPFISISAKTGDGFDKLMDRLRASLANEGLEDTAVLTNARHFELLQRLSASLRDALHLMREEDSPDIVALELQFGLQSLHELLGIVYDDQVMDKVFQEFCIGK